MSLASSVMAWESERPSAYIIFDDRTENSYTDGAATVGLGVHVTEYFENSPTFDYYDVLGLRITNTASTREIITYGVSTDSYTWYTVTDPTYVTGDDESRWISFPYPVRFYGGRRSAEYNGVYVCSNGFITFDSNPTNPYYSGSIPETVEPNTFIAPFWRDLDPSSGGSITWGCIPDSGISDLLVISWNNVPNKKNGIPQTFQVVVEFAPGSSYIYRQSRIWFNYQSITLDDATTVGIEDQRGLRGVSYDYQDLSNGMTLKLRQTSNSAFIQYITVKLNRGGDEYAIIDIDQDPGWIRGHNVMLESEEPDETARYAMALAGGCALLLEAFSPWEWVATAGFMIGATLYGVDVAELVARAMSPATDLTIEDDLPTPRGVSYVKAAADRETPTDYFTVVDADLGIRVFWMFNDPNDRDHNLTITAELEYAEFDSTGALVNHETILTSVTLKLLREVEPKIVSLPADIIGTLGVDDQADYFKFQVTVSADPDIHVRLTPPADADFDLQLLDSNSIVVAYSKNRGVGLTESIDYSVYETSVWYVKVVWYSGGGIYNLNIFLGSGPPGGPGRFLLPY